MAEVRRSPLPFPTLTTFASTFVNEEQEQER